MTDDQIKEIKEKFLQEYDTYSKVAYKVIAIIKDSLKSNNIKTAHVLFRIKDIDSFIEKTIRKGYDDPFTQMTDIIGIRIVCLYTEDIGSIDQIIRDDFKVIRREYKLDGLGSDLMGYPALHVDAKLKDDDTELQNYQFEIQVRSIMVDAISIISQDLSYKKEILLPEKLQRELNLAFATMELTQYHCDSLRDKRKEYSKEVTDEANDQTKFDSFLSQPIMDDTLRVYTNHFFPGLPIKEHIHTLILRDLDRKKYKLLRDIHRAVEHSKDFVEYYKTKSDSFKSGSDYITKSLGYYDEAFMHKHPFVQKTRDAIVEFKSRLK